MITINHKDDKFILTFPYNQEDLQQVQNSLPVRTWDKKEKVWEVPQLCVKTLDNLKNVSWEENAEIQKGKIERALLSLVDYKFKKGESNNFLLPHQRVGADYLKIAKKALLADGLGLGKSLMAITAAKEKIPEKCLVLCPSSLRYNWENEFKKHYNIEPLVIDGTRRKREQLWKEKSQFTIATYDILRNDSDIYPKKWDIIIADEAVFLKTGKALRTKKAKKLESDYKFGLSGYYIENNLMEFQSMMEWVRPELLPSAYQFKYRYCELDFWGNITGYENLDELHQLTSPFLLRRTEEEIFPNLLPQKHIPIEIKFDKQHQQAYNAIVKEFMDWLKANSKFNLKTALEKTIRLRQFVEFPEILGFNFESQKLQWLREFVKDKGRVVIFTYFKDSADLLCKYLNTPYKITGDVDSKERFETIQKFDNDTKPIICTDAGKFGINFTSADYIIHFGYFYNPATLNQRNGRLRRMWRNRETYIVEPYYKNSIDEGIMQIYRNRDKFVQEFINGDICMSLAKLSKKDFEKLIYGEFDG